MEFQELIEQRYSVRAYKPDDIPSNVIDKILEVARLAPTAANRQSFKLFVIKTDVFKDELKKIYHQEWFIQAPYVIGICGIPEGNWVRRDGKNYTDVDSAIVMDHVILSATDLGLGTCWVGAFDEETAARAIKTPPDVRPVAMIPIGKPAEKPTSASRIPLDKIVHKDTF